jgi:general secretion pathway protein L
MDAHGLIVCLPAGGGASQPRLFWWRVEDGAVISRGIRHFDDDADEQVVADWGVREDGGKVLALVPSADCNVHFLEMDDMPPRQAEAAARLKVAETSLGGFDTNHITASTHSHRHPPHTIVATTSIDRMRQWLAFLDMAGIDPDIVMPAGLGLPEANGAAVQGQVGDEKLIRSGHVVSPDEPGLRQALIGDQEVVLLDEAQVDAALVEALAEPEVNLRQGMFARKIRREWLAWAQIRHLLRMAAVIALITLAIFVIRIAKLEYAASLLEDRAVVAAQERYPAVTDLAAAEAAVNADLAKRGLGDTLFTVPASAAFAAMQSVPSVSVRDVGFAGDGIVSMTMAAPRKEDIDQILIRLQQQGYQVTVPPTITQDTTGSIVAQITVRAS